MRARDLAPVIWYLDSLGISNHVLLGVVPHKYASPALSDATLRAAETNVIKRWMANCANALLIWVCWWHGFRVLARARLSGLNLDSRVLLDAEHVERLQLAFQQSICVVTYAWISGHWDAAISPNTG